MKEKYKTLKNVFDLFTEKNLFKLISQGYFDGLESPVSIGKEANIFTAKHGEDTRIVKIYRLQTADFNRMYDYLKADPRYASTKKNRRDVIFSWAHREYRNLHKAREAEVRVPTPYTATYNILVMQMIGGEKPAPQLHKARPEEPAAFFKELVAQVKKLYSAGLIHADLSGFNILNHNEKPVLIDMSQATPLDNPYAEEYLKRDLKNICVLFEKWGVKTNQDKLFKRITSQGK